MHYSTGSLTSISRSRGRSLTKRATALLLASAIICAALLLAISLTGMSLGTRFLSRSKTPTTQPSAAVAPKQSSSERPKTFTASTGCGTQHLSAATLPSGFDSEGRTRELSDSLISSTISTSAPSLITGAKRSRHFSGTNILRRARLSSDVEQKRNWTISAEQQAGNSTTSMTEPLTPSLLAQSSGCATTRTSTLSARRKSSSERSLPFSISAPLKSAATWTGNSFASVSPQRRLIGSLSLIPAITQRSFTKVIWGARSRATLLLTSKIASAMTA